MDWEPAAAVAAGRGVAGTDCWPAVPPRSAREAAGTDWGLARPARSGRGAAGTALRRAPARQASAQLHRQAGRSGSESEGSDALSYPSQLLSGRAPGRAFYQACDSGDRAAKCPRHQVEVPAEEACELRV